MNDLPEDYEACGECGYDHDYEPTAAYQAHQDLIQGFEHDEEG